MVIRVNNVTVKSTIEAFFKHDAEYKFVFIDGDGDCVDEFRVYFTGATYVDDYRCTINISLDLVASMWSVDVNGFNSIDFIDNETELKFALKQQMKFSRVPCPDQKLASLGSSQDSYY
jgi:hypothetical protein